MKFKSVRHSRYVSVCVFACVVRCETRHIGRNSPSITMHTFIPQHTHPRMASYRECELRTSSCAMLVLRSLGQLTSQRSVEPAFVVLIAREVDFDSRLQLQQQHVIVAVMTHAQRSSSRMPLHVSCNSAFTLLIASLFIISDDAAAVGMQACAASQGAIVGTASCSSQLTCILQRHITCSHAYRIYTRHCARCDLAGSAPPQLGLPSQARTLCDAARLHL